MVANMHKWWGGQDNNQVQLFMSEFHEIRENYSQNSEFTPHPTIRNVRVEAISYNINCATEGCQTRNIYERETSYTLFLI